YDVCLRLRLRGPGGRRWRASVTDHLDLRSGDRVLDVACGPGHLAADLAGRVAPGGSVDGIDAAQERVKHAQGRVDRLGLPVTFQTATAQQLPFADGTFAGVTCTMALHHIDPSGRGRAIEEMRRVLRPGGRLVVADAQPPQAGIRSLLPRLMLGHAMREQPLAQAEQLLRQAGLAAVTRTGTSVSWVGAVTGIATDASG
ncbi:MAG: methyltransferase domain-containing protein, partial [Dermatophilaceae bacterium]